MTTTDKGIQLTGNQVIAMYPASVARGTDAHWPAVAMQWIQQAESEIVRLTALAGAAPATPTACGGNDKLLMNGDGSLRVERAQPAPAAAVDPIDEPYGRYSFTTEMHKEKQDRDTAALRAEREAETDPWPFPDPANRK
jgi:hypothetical protein